MKINAVVLALVVALVSAQAQNCQPQTLTFSEFQTKFNRTYPNASETTLRQGIYDSNVQSLTNSNCCYCGVTKYFDRSAAEIASKYNFI